MSSSVTYRQLILRLPEGLKEAMRSRIATDAGIDGVDFSPVKKGSRRFNFTMDGKTYPARLVDLPCVVESQKTLDRSTFFKSGDIGQMLIVYKDDAAFKKDDSSSSGSASRGYYADGLSAPTMNVVQRRFLKARPDQGKFDPAEVIRVESQVLKMQQDPTDAFDKNKKAGAGAGAGAGGAGAGSPGGSGNGDGLDGASGGGSASKPAVGGNALRKGVLGDSGKGGSGNVDGDRVVVEHEEIVPFEPWMADPDIAAVGRLEGISLEIKGATDMQDAAAARGRGATSGSPTYGRVGGVDGSGGALPRLFGHELLYEHPEILLSAVDETPEDPTLRPPPDPGAKSTSPQPPGKAAKKELATSVPGSTKGAGSAPSSSSSSSRGGGHKEKRRANSGASVAPDVGDNGARPSRPATAMGSGGAVAGAGPDAAADLPMDPDISSAVMSALEDSDLLDSVPVDLFSGLPAGDDDGAASWAEDD